MEPRNFIVPKNVTQNSGGDFFSIAIKDIPDLAESYVEAMETEVSNKWCRCEWIVHPDDSEIKENQCRVCGVMRNNHLSFEDDINEPDDEEFPEDLHDFLGRRMRRGEEHSLCPVHTKKGFVLGFFEYVFPPKG